MRAAVVERPGHPPTVVPGREPPAAGPGEVLVDVLAAPITPLDLLRAVRLSDIHASCLISPARHSQASLRRPLADSVSPGGRS
jgi:hypothetical protein